MSTLLSSILTNLRRLNDTLTSTVNATSLLNVRKVSSEGLLTASFPAKTNQSAILGTEAFFRLEFVLNGSFTAGETLGTFYFGRVIPEGNYFVRITPMNFQSTNSPVGFAVNVRSTTSFTIIYGGANATWDSDSFYMYVEVIEYV